MAGASPNDSSPSPTKPLVSSPWSQIVRGESELVVAAAPPAAVVEASSAASVNSLAAEESGSVVAESFDDGGAGHNAGKRPAWNKPLPSNGAASEVKSVMDAVSWPALSESTRATVKSPSESSKGLMDGSPLPQLQGIGSVVSSSQRQVRDNASPNITVPTHQKQFKRSNSNPSSNGGHPPQQSAPQGSMATTGSGSGSGSHNSSPKAHQPRSGFVSNDHPQHRNSFRNRNGGPHQRGDGAQHHNYGSRRDPERGNQDWNNQRNFNGRETYMPPRFVPRFIRPPPPPNSAQFIPPPPMRPFGGSIGYSELPPPMVYVPAPPPDSLRGVPFVPPIPPHAVFFPAPDPQLHTRIVNQIDYYFSNENLIKDIYLRQNMDDQGWVSIRLIAGFNKIMLLTDNIQIVLDAVRTSSVVEVQGDKIRRRNDWRRWIMPPVQLPNIAGSLTLGKLSHDMLAEQVQSIALGTTNKDGAGGLDLPDASQNRPSFGDLNSPLLLSTSEGTGQVGIQVSDHSISARN